MICSLVTFVFSFDNYIQFNCDIVIELCYSYSAVTFMFRCVIQLWHSYSVVTFMFSCVIQLWHSYSVMTFIFSYDIHILLWYSYSVCKIHIQSWHSYSQQYRNTKTLLYFLINSFKNRIGCGIKPPQFPWILSLPLLPPSLSITPKEVNRVKEGK